MTDKRSHLFVALADDYRDDDAEPIVNAILQIRGVAGVQRGAPVDSADYIARSRFRNNLASQVIDLIIGGNTKGQP